MLTQPYLHASRHNHAARRIRGAGGRFLNADEARAYLEHAAVPHDLEKDRVDIQPCAKEAFSGIEREWSCSGSASSTHRDQNPCSGTAPRSAFGSPPAPLDTVSQANAGVEATGGMGYLNGTTGATMQSPQQQDMTGVNSGLHGTIGVVRVQ